MAKAVVEKKYDSAFPGYTGRILWDVFHPDYKKPVRVLAPRAGNKTNEASIQAAALFWKRRWQDYDFYAFCVCSLVNGTEANS